LEPVALKTSAGDFRLSEPYTEDPAGDGSQTYSINWGLFWAEMPAERDE